jgi:hypothetical protein
MYRDAFRFPSSGAASSRRRPLSGLWRSACTAALFAGFLAAGPGAASANDGEGSAPAGRQTDSRGVTLTLQNTSGLVGRYRVVLESKVSVRGVAEPGSRVKIFLNGKVAAEVTAARAGRFAKEFKLEQGFYVITARAKAPDGDASTSGTLRIQVAPPALIRLDELKPSEGFSITRVPDDRIFGRAAAAPAGDINCDGYADLYVNRVPDGRKQLPAFVLFGRADGFPRPIPYNDIGKFAGFEIVSPKGIGTAQTVHSIDDIDGDGCSDLALFYYSDGTSVPNHTVLLYGRKEGFPDKLNVDTLGALEAFRVSGDFFVHRFAAGDFNADGFSDVALSSPGARGKGFGNEQGLTHVVFGQSRPNDGHVDLDALNGENGFRIIGVRGSRSGSSLATVDGFDGDDISDLLIGAPDGTAPGRGAQILFGQPDGFPATVQLVANPDAGTVIGPAKGAKMFGAFASSGGDFNGDGFGDVLVGTTDTDEGAYIVFGRDNPPSSAVVTALPAPSSVRLYYPDLYGDELALASLGDASGDGRDDIAIGVPEARAAAGPFWVGGAVFVLHGRKKPLPAELNLAFLTPDLGSMFVGPTDAFGRNGMFGIGKTVANAGDVNGDGVDDLLLAVENVGSESSSFGSVFVIYGKRPDEISMPMPQ